MVKKHLILLLANSSDLGSYLETVGYHDNLCELRGVRYQVHGDTLSGHDYTMYLPLHRDELTHKIHINTFAQTMQQLFASELDATELDSELSTTITVSSTKINVSTLTARDSLISDLRKYIYTFSTV